MNKSKISYAIKHSNILKNGYITLGSAFLRLAGLFVKQDDRLILFVGNIGKSFSGSPYAIYEYIKNDKKYSEYKCIWAFNHPEKFEGIPAVKFDTFKYFMTALKAKYWVTDVNIERSLKFKKKSTKYLNTWHGVALKKIGNDDPNSGRYDYSNIDYLCVSGEHDKRVYTSALNASEHSFLECGMPRNDSLFKVTDKDREAARTKLGIKPDQIAVLYAPTWRDSTNQGESFDLKIPADFRHWQEILGKKYVLLFRAHDRTTKLMDIHFNDFIRDYGNYEPLNDLLVACDLLITDYSSIVFDYSLLNKPFLCFGYDYEQYVRERGVYFDPEQAYPDGVIRTEDELLDRIKHFNRQENLEGMKKLRDSFMEYSHGDAAKKCAEALLSR